MGILTKNYPFTTPGNYTHSDENTEIAGGKAKLIDRRPADVTLFANYDVDADFDAKWGDGSLTGTVGGSPTVSGGYLRVITGNDLRYSANDGNVPDPQIFTWRGTVQPQYSGTPAGNRYYFALGQTGAANLNRFDLFQQSGSGQLKIQAHDSGGTQKINSNLGAWSPTSGTDYDFELNVDIDAGVLRLYIDGTLHGSLSFTTFTRASTTYIRLGEDGKGNSNCDQWYKRFVMFSTIQHSSDFTPSDWTEFPPTIYAIHNPDITFDETISMKGLDDFLETSTKTGSDELKYNLKKGGSFYYWTGAVWAVADGTYAQSNTAAVVATNKASFISSPDTVQVKMFVHSDDGSTTPEADNVQVDYDPGVRPQQVLLGQGIF